MEVLDILGGLLKFVDRYGSFVLVSALTTFYWWLERRDRLATAKRNEELADKFHEALADVVESNNETAASMTLLAKNIENLKRG